MLIAVGTKPSEMTIAYDGLAPCPKQKNIQSTIRDQNLGGR